MKDRLITFIALIAIVIPIVLIGSIPFDIFIILIANVGIWEINKVRGKKYPLLVRILLHLYITLFLLLSINKTSFDYNVGLFLILILLFLIPSLVYQSNDLYNICDAMYLIATELLLSIGFSVMIITRNINLFVCGYLFILTSLNDIFAFVFGKLLGKHKLCESVSPHKTIEGSIGGMVVSIIFSTLVYYYLVPNTINLLLITSMSFVLSIMSILGDLIFSAIKRQYKIKDFSNFLPGHGGILDRTDSILIVMITYAIIFITFS